ncbi:MAG: S-methyl-5'-thioadenosine phosphorylase [Dialister sp.]|nr:S-methyl-5'-thioadenosine phosphorylase [Dialister sp.]
MAKLAFIGGTGVYDPGILTESHSEVIDTPYGCVPYTAGKVGNKDIVFMARHGLHHTIPPHKINYRANIYALKMLGVSSIVSTTAVGSLNPSYKPGELVLVDQFIDFTKAREHTFFDGVHRGVAHIDMTHPYCETLREAILSAGKQLNIPIHPSGTYICTEGPRFETPAEIKAFSLLGADVVGMTNVPECQLAREAEMCYATISMVTNYAAGITSEILTHKEVLECMDANIGSFRKIITILCDSYVPETDCSCHHAAQDFGGFSV